MNSPAKNLILIAHAKKHDPRDLLEIGRKVIEQARDIAAFIVSRDDPAEVISASAWQRPTLTVSFDPFTRFVPKRGPFLANRPIKKLDQYARFAEAGINTPRTARYVPGTQYHPSEWSDFVVLKPLPLSMTSKGTMAKLYRTLSLNRKTIRDFPEDHPIHAGPMLIQPFIDTGRYPTQWRVLTLFGEPLYSMKSWVPVARPEPSASDEEIERAIIEHKHPRLKIDFEYKNMRTLARDDEVFDFARGIHTAFPRIPLKACDILREEKTGKLYVLEINAGGNTWHFSSKQFRWNRDQLGGKRAFVEQLDAWNRAAEVLIRQTREYAA